MGKKPVTMICFVLTAILTAGALAGCGQKKAAGGKSEDRAKGRYLETDIDLPENTVSVADMVELEDGSIRIAARNSQKGTGVWNLEEDGSTWEKCYDLPEEWADREDFFTDISLSPKGDAFVITNEGEEFSEVHYYLLDGSGSFREIPVDRKDYMYFRQYTRDGEFFFQSMNAAVGSVDMDTGEVEEIDTGSERASFFGTAGNTLYLASYEGKIDSYDLQSREMLPADEGLEDLVKQSGSRIELTSIGHMPLVFTEGGEEDEIFFCSDKGLYRYVKNGTVAEQIIDGSLTSMASPDTGLRALEERAGEFYLLASASGGDHLLHYVYSKETATVPETHLKAWSLHENRELKQNIAQYQKEHPEVYVELETGASKDKGATDSDALKNLSTEIMAGKGPDLLVLDGTPVDSYLEKGLLEDLTDVAMNGEELFSNLMKAVEQEDKIYGIPLRFSLPMIQGKGEILEKVQDLTSLADAVEELKGQEGESDVYNPYYNGMALAVQLYDSCAPAWMNEKGGLEEDRLEEFYTQIQRMYDPDHELVDGQEIYVNVIGDEGSSGSFGELSSTIGSDILSAYHQKVLLNFGNASSEFDLAGLFTTTADVPEIQYRPFSGQAEGVYVPQMVMGISSRSGAKEEAKKFLASLLTEEAQKASQGAGLPVNQKALRALTEKMEDSVIGSGMANEPDSYMEMSIRKPEAQAVEEFIDYVKGASTPALSNEVLRNAVLAQAQDCAQGKITPGEGAKNVSESIRLFLAE